MDLRYVGFNLDPERLEKIKIISFITDKNRTDLIKEGIDLVIEKHSGCFEKFQKYVEKLK